MLKATEYILILFCGMSLIVLAFLFNGIEIEKISYKNINIEKLYLKLDKKLTIKAPQITISDGNATIVATMSTHFTVGYKSRNIVFGVENFSLKGTDLEVKGDILLDIKKVDFDFKEKSSIVVENLLLQFDKKLQKVSAEKAFVIFENNQFDVTFENPLYHDIDMTHSTVNYSIDNNALNLALQTTSLYNDTLDQILKRYDLEVEVKQLSGKNEIKTNIFIPFSQGDFFIEAYIKSKDATIESYDQIVEATDIDLHYENKSNTLKGEVYLKNYIFNDIKFFNSKIKYDVLFAKDILIAITAKNLHAQYGEIKVNLTDTAVGFENLKMQVASELRLDDNISFLNFQNSTDFKTQHSQSKMFINYQKEKHLYDLQVINEIDFKAKSSTGTMTLNTIKYDNLVEVTNKSIPYTLLFKDEILFSIQDFGLSYFKEKETGLHSIHIKKPKKLMDAFTFLDYKNSAEGIIKIESNNFEKTAISIDNFNFDIDSSYFKSDNSQIKKLTIPILPTIDLEYTNSTIKYDDYSLLFDRLQLKTEKYNIQASMLKDKTIFELKIEDGIVEAHGYNLTDTYLNRFLNKEFLQGGYLNINAYTDDINFLMGDVNFHDTTLKNVTVINSLTTFVNTTPAIINPLLALPTLYRMAETGFDTNGYYMKYGDGSFHYSVQQKQLDLFDLKTNGKMSDFNINAHMDFATNEIDAKVNISFLKDFTQAINYIPVVGYIFLGDDGEFYTSVDITGSLDDPILETHTVKESSRGVTNIIKRILTLPLQPFNIETSPEQLKEHNKRVDAMFNN
ncbi:MAG: AsmA-like C-terminal domain-containing protein [Arcobacteraceae bacterium]